MATPSVPVITQYPVASNQTLQFYWAPPATGAPLTNYTLTLNPGALTYTVSSGATNYTVSGLTNGTTYTATLYATNGNGDGPAAPFESAEPGFLPNPPDSATATAIGSGTVIVSWTPPSTLPIARIRYYVVEVVSSDPADNVNPTRYSEYSTDRNQLVISLSPSKQYSFKVYTVNSVGYSVAQTTITMSFRDNQGQVQWATGLFGNTTASFSSQKTAVDGSGNIYVLGTAAGGPSLTLFDFVSAPATPGEQISTTVSAVYTGTNGILTPTHVILAKYNSAGILQWAVPIQMTSTGSAIGVPLSLTVDGSGNPMFAITYGANALLTFNNFVSINSTTKLTQVQPCGIYNISSGTQDILIIKYNSTGQFQWITTVGSASVSEIQGGSFQFTNALTTDTIGNIYILLQNSSFDTGVSYFYNATTFIGANLTPVLYGGCLGRGFLVKYNAQGQVQWINRITGSSTSASGKLAIATDKSNNILTTEYAFRDQSTFIETVVGVSAGILSTTRTICIPAINTTGYIDFILSKYNLNGQFLYATRTNDRQTSGTGANYFTAIATDTNNAVYLATSNSPLTSNFLNSYYSTFDGSNVSTIQGPRLENFSSASDVYIIKYNSSFQFQTAAGFYISTGSALAMSQPGGIVCDSYNNVYLSGNFRSTMQVRTYLSTTYNNGMVWSTIATTSNYNSTTSFLAKFDSNLNYKWLTIMASYNGSPSTSNAITINQWLAIDNSNTLYTNGSWSIKDPIAMQFAHASTITTDRYIQTQPYGYLSSFTSTGNTNFNNSYLAKFA